jgi:hypothetical protein
MKVVPFTECCFRYLARDGARSLCEYRHPGQSKFRITNGSMTREPPVRRSCSFQPFQGMVTQRLAGIKGVVAGL